MRPKILIAAGLVVAFMIGAAANGIYSSTTRAFNPEEEQAIVQQRAVARPAVATRTQYAQPRTVYVSNPAVRETAPAPVNAERKRSLKKEILIVGGSAGAGAAVGAVAGGKKGAAIGALSGGIAGLVYDLATRNK
jgi:UDP-N-acetylglucosamine:LPS N-acetylglucosamine transferase